MLKNLQESKNFSQVIKKGIYSPSVLTSFDEQRILTSWMMESYRLPTEVVFLVHKIKKQWKGVIEINETPCLGLKFLKRELKFYPLSPHGFTIAYGEWCKIWLYDTRVHASVAFAIKCIHEYEQK